MIQKTEAKNISKNKEEKNMRLSKDLVAELIYRERRFPVVVSETKAKKSQVASIACLIDETTGHNFVAGKELIEAMQKMSATDLKVSLDSFLAAYAVNTGEYVDMEQFTMYQDYPNFIMTADMEEVIFRQCISYIAQFYDRYFDTNFHSEIFDTEVIERGEDAATEYDTVQSIVLRPGTEEDALRITKAIIASKLNLCAEDESLLKRVLNSLDNDTIVSVIPAKITQKTTLKMVAAILLSKNIPLEILGIKNSVDAIRLAHELSKDVNKFSLNNRERMAILDLINKDSHANANMFAHREDFLRLGEHIHPNKYAKRFPNAFKAFTELRDKKHTERTFMSKYLTEVSAGNALKAANALAYIPGKFAQELDALLTLAVTEEKQNEILKIFESVAANAPAKRLYQAYCHFSKRNDNVGVVTKHVRDRYTRPIEYTKEVVAISENVAKRASEIAFNAFCETLKDVSAKKYYINEERFSSAIIDKIGSKIAIRDTDWLRLFVYWCGCDVDLTAVFLNENFEYMEQVSWQRLRSNDNGTLAVHSEDITYAPNGGTEYIDINRNKAKELAKTVNYRYIAIINLVFSGPAFHKMPDAFTGVMAVNEPGAGTVFKPNAVAIKSKIKSGRGNLAFLYDIVEDKVILVNSDITPRDESNRVGITINDCIDEIISACKSVINSEKYNLYQYLKDYVIVTNGEIVEDKAEADVIFDVDGIDIFDDVLYSEYI